MEKAVVAGGCFWCIEHAFHDVKGIISVKSGYTGGKVANPTYEQVCTGRTGHLEALEIIFDPKIISFEKILTIFWRQIDPLDPSGQYYDRGEQYTTAIFYQNEEQRQIAIRSKEMKQRFYAEPIATKILPAQPFYEAEEMHQGYCYKQPERYKQYAAGRQKRKLTSMQYKVTCEEGTEPPFENAYWNNHEEGIYVDVISGEPLFSSTHKFDSGTGWPSFTQPIVSENVTEKEDHKLGMTRTEVRGAKSDAHLGHLFPDGPLPTGERYCINSASLRFIPKDRLEAEGFGDLLYLFE